MDVSQDCESCLEESKSQAVLFRELLAPEEKETETEYFQIHKWILSAQASFG